MNGKGLSEKRYGKTALRRQRSLVQSVQRAAQSVHVARQMVKKIQRRFIV